jgi:glutamate racemase
MVSETAAIGIFDSGLGGLTVLRAIRAELPQARLLYLGDNAHIPYGARPLAEVRAFSEAITRFLIAQGAAAIVIACNTASAAALHSLRATEAFAGVPFVGMEPAVKPASASTRSGVVGVLATPATFQGELYASVVERYARGVRVIEQVCPGLVQRIEAGDLDSFETEMLLRGWVEPLLAEGADTLVMGCTHYPFVIPLLERIAGPAVTVIDPAPAVARQTARVWSQLQQPDQGPVETPSAGIINYFTSGSPAIFGAALERLGIERGEIRPVEWTHDGVRWVVNASPQPRDR